MGQIDSRYYDIEEKVIAAKSLKKDVILSGINAIGLSGGTNVLSLSAYVDKRREILEAIENRGYGENARKALLDDFEKCNEAIRTILGL